MVLAAQALVAPPDQQPYPYGLFSVVTLDSLTGERWENGVTWEGPTCDGVTVIPHDNLCVTPPTLAYNTGGVIGDADAFTVYAGYKCSPVGRSIDEAQERATANLLTTEQAAVEAYWWDNLDASLPVLGGASQDAATALGLLEAYIVSETGGTGVVHVPRALAPTLAQRHLISGSGARMTTALGTPVSVGNYGDTPSDQSAAGAGLLWMGVTPPLLAQRGDVFTGSDVTGDLLDRRQNNLYALAQRTYLLGHSLCGAALVRAAVGCCP